MWVGGSGGGGTGGGVVVMVAVVAVVQPGPQQFLRSGWTPSGPTWTKFKIS